MSNFSAIAKPPFAVDDDDTKYIQHKKQPITRTREERNKVSESMYNAYDDYIKPGEQPSKSTPQTQDQRLALPSSSNNRDSADSTHGFVGGLLAYSDSEDDDDDSDDEPQPPSKSKNKALFEAATKPEPSYKPKLSEQNSRAPSNNGPSSSNLRPQQPPAPPSQQQPRQQPPPPPSYDQRRPSPTPSITPPPPAAVNIQVHQMNAPQPKRPILPSGPNFQAQPQQQVSQPRQQFGGPGDGMNGPSGPNVDGPPGPNIRGPPGPNMNGSGPNFGGPPGPNMNGPTGPNMRGPPGPNMNGPNGPMRGPGLAPLQIPPPSSYNNGQPTPGFSAGGFNSASPIGSPGMFHMSPTPMPESVGTPIEPAFIKPIKPAFIRQDDGEKSSSLMSHESSIPIMRGDKEDYLPLRSGPRTPRVGQKPGTADGDDFWRRFSMVVKQDKVKPASQKKSDWLKSNLRGGQAYNRWIWCFSVFMIVGIIAGSFCGWYFTKGNPAHAIPVAIGGGASETMTAKSTANPTPIGNQTKTATTTKGAKATTTAAAAKHRRNNTGLKARRSQSNRS